MKRVLLVLTLLAAPLAAQEQKAEAAGKPAPAPNVQKVFILKYADPDNMRMLLEAFGAGLHPSSEMHVLAVSASPATMQAIEEAIGRLDVPSAAPRDLDFTVDLVVGTDAEDPVSAAVPKELDSVVAQLKGAFPFKNYRLLDVLTLRTRAGRRASTQSSGGLVRVGGATERVSSYFDITSTSVGADGATVHIDRFSSQTTYPYEVSPGKTAVEQLKLYSDLDIKEGQKVVVGRMGMNSQQALFLVLMVKVVQ